jgi:predicted permease
MNTLSKLNFYIFVPAITFVMIIDTTLSSGLIVRISSFLLVLTSLLFAAGWIASSFGRFKALRPLVVSNSIFNNCGNYGIPLVTFAFQPDPGMAVAVIALLIVLQNLLTFTIGLWLFDRKPGRSLLRSVTGILKVPVLWAVALGWLLQSTSLKVPDNLMMPMRYLADGLIPLALITLGVQLSRSMKLTDPAAVSLMTGLRLLLAPVAAFLLLPLFGFDAEIRRILIVASGLPSAVNVFILAEEYKRRPDIASQTVFWSTLVSVVTVSVLLILVA